MIIIIIIIHNDKIGNQNNECNVDITHSMCRVMYRARGKEEEVCLKQDDLTRLSSLLCLEKMRMTTT